MSRLPQSTSKTKIQTKYSLVKTTSRTGGEKTKMGTTKMASTKMPSSKQPAAKKTEKSAPPKKEFELPPLSILSKQEQKTALTEIEKMKKKTIRRNKPEGEDPKKIREIIKTVKGQDVTVQEFVGLISPFTADNGTVLRNVMADDLSTFRSMVKKIYDNMTQDVSDVLINEQTQLTDFYKERQAQLTNRMERAIDEILALAPDFDFDRYYKDPNYLDSVFPLANLPGEGGSEDLEGAEMQKRQEAYHKLQWLRNEGERLNEENVRLQERLTCLKKQQREELKACAFREQQAEQKKCELENAQDEVKSKLDDLNRTLEEAIIDHEQHIVQDQDLGPRLPKPKSSKSLAKPKTSARRKPKWNVEAAKEIEDTATTENLESEMSRVSFKSSSKIELQKSRSRSRAQGKGPPPKRDQSPFHYSPIKTPPRSDAQPRPSSPFHYSPPRTPPGMGGAPCARPTSSPQQQRRQQQQEPRDVETTRVESTTTITRPPRLRRNQGPRDTWGGF